MTADPPLDPIPWTPLARVLYQLMSDLSEKCWCAGWMGGTERAVWALIVGDEAGTVWSATEDEIAAIKVISDLAGVWIVWADHDAAPVDLDQWRAYYRENHDR